jgi:VWFA-related protein
VRKQFLLGGVPRGLPGGLLGAALRGVLLAGAIPLIGAAQTTPPKSKASAPAAQAQAQESGSSQSGYVLKVKTRLVTLDVLATDANGKAVRDLKPEDFQIVAEHNKPQTISHFEFMDTRAALPNPPAPPSPGSGQVYSNQTAFEHLDVPPTVLLVDSLNTELTNQAQARLQMIRLLKTLPRDTPVAVFLLGGSLRLVQGFTSNPAVLLAAVNQLVAATTPEQGSPAALHQSASDDPDSPKNMDLQMNDTTTVPDADSDSGGSMPVVFRLIIDFQKEQIADSIDLRVTQTLDALTEIARYLSGIPGRKNLLWLSESFPTSIMPDVTTGVDPFAGSRDFSDKVKAAANVLVDAQVAVYPVDVVGLEPYQSGAASQMGVGTNMTTLPTGTGGSKRNPGEVLVQEAAAEPMEVMQGQVTMDELAQDTGGKACKNTNDLSGCVKTAMNDAASYYELAFYPQNIPWDGNYHTLAIKTTRPGLKLAYRRGYFALDADSLAKAEKPEDRIRQACSDLLPSTTIPVMVQPLPPAQGSLRYGVLMPADLAAASGNGERQLNIEAATCSYRPQSGTVLRSEHAVKQAVSDAQERTWEDQGIPVVLDVVPAPDLDRVRFVVLDATTGLTGAVDVPVSAADIAKAGTTATPSP